MFIIIIADTYVEWGLQHGKERLGTCQEYEDVRVDTWRDAVVCQGHI